jgi:hypothetical protein
MSYDRPDETTPARHQPPLAALDAPLGGTAQPTAPPPAVVCACELRNRRWNPVTGRCETCGWRYPAHISQPPPPATGTPARTLADELLGQMSNVQVPMFDAYTCKTPNDAYLRGFIDARELLAEVIATHPALRQPAPVAADGAGHGERRWIPVSESMPQDGDEILIAESAGGGKWNIEAGMYEGEGHFIDGYGQRCVPSHWMPLPNPPGVVPVRVTVLADDAEPAGADARKFSAIHREFDEIEQALGKALGYPSLYPDASPVDDGRVCVGDHVAATLAREAAARLAASEAARAAAEGEATRLRTAVEWYADAKNYTDRRAPYAYLPAQIDGDNGARARAALAAPAGGAAGRDGGQGDRGETITICSDKERRPTLNDAIVEDGAPAASEEVARLRRELDEARAQRDRLADGHR